MAVRTEHSEVYQKWQSANIPHIPQYCPKQVRLVSRLLNGINSLSDKALLHLVNVCNPTLNSNLLQVKLNSY